MFVVEDDGAVIVSTLAHDYHSINGNNMALYGFLSYSSEISFSCFDYDSKYNKQFPSHGSFVTSGFRNKIRDFLMRLFE